MNNQKICHEKEDTTLSLKKSRWKLKQQDGQNKPMDGRALQNKH